MRHVSIALLFLSVTLVGCSGPATPADTAAAPATPVLPADPAALAPPAPGAPAASTTAPAISATPVTPGRVSAPPAVGAPPVESAPATPAARRGVSATSPAPAAATPVTPAAPPVAEFRDVTIPSGTRLSIELRTGVGSATSAVEDRVSGVLQRPVAIDGDEVLPAGTAVSGAVTEALRAARVKGRARLAVRFTSVTVDDEALRITTAPIVREAAGTKKEDATKIGIGAGAGAIIGAIAGGKKGAVTGGAIGAGAGTGVVLGTRGDEVAIVSGTTVTTTLSAPLVVRVRVP